MSLENSHDHNGLGEDVILSAVLSVYKEMSSSASTGFHRLTEEGKTSVKTPSTKISS